MSNQARKSLYIFLSALMGALIFTVLHRVLVFGYLMLLNINYTSFSFGMSDIELLAWDYFTLILALLLGMWYGVWVGLHWYELVYEKKIHGGFLKAFSDRIWQGSGQPEQVAREISTVAQKVETEMWQLEDLAEEIPHDLEPVTVPVKRKAPARPRTVKKRAAKIL